MTSSKNILDILGATFGMSESKAKTSSTGAEYIRFDRDIHFTFGAGDPQHRYRERTPKEKSVATTTKYGQLKLLLSELQFFNLYYDPSVHKEPICVYIGAALGTHIATLARMYPTISFKLYDPQPFNEEALLPHKFNIKEEPISNIEIFQQFFTDKESKYWAKQQKEGKNIFLIVDIRNSGYQKIKNVRENQDAFRKNEKLVADDMELQRKWFENIRPTKALLKMRLPYYEDFLTTPETIFPYLDGIVYRQQFTPQTSTETRLVPFDASESGIYPTRNWNIITYENVTNSHNKFLRESQKFINPFSYNDNNTQIDDPIAVKIGLYNDYDSTAATLIILDYLQKFGINSTKEQFYQLAKNIFIEVGKSNMWNWNLLGARERVHFMEEDGNIPPQTRKTKNGFDDPENDINAWE